MGLNTCQAPKSWRTRRERSSKHKKKKGSKAGKDKWGVEDGNETILAAGVEISQDDEATGE